MIDERGKLCIYLSNLEKSVLFRKRPSDSPRTTAVHLGDDLHIVDKPDDAKLALLYRNALYTVIPGPCEGWGLPVGESL